MDRAEEVELPRLLEGEAGPVAPAQGQVEDPFLLRGPGVGDSVVVDHLDRVPHADRGRTGEGEAGDVDGGGGRAGDGGRGVGDSRGGSRRHGGGSGGGGGGLLASAGHGPHQEADQDQLGLHAVLLESDRSLLRAGPCCGSRRGQA